MRLTQSPGGRSRTCILTRWLERRIPVRARRRGYLCHARFSAVPSGCLSGTDGVRGILPKGDWIAYWTGFSTGDPTAPGSNKIFIVPAHGGAPKQLAPQFESAMFPVWSPDGKHVLFLGARGSDSTRRAER